MELFGVGIPELGLVALIALIIVGPQRFPELARNVARWIRTARAFSDAVMKDVRSAVDEIEQEVTAAKQGVSPIRELSELRKELNTAASEASATVEEARTLPPPPVNDEWAAVTETTATLPMPEATPDLSGAPSPAAGPAEASSESPTPVGERKADG